MKRKLTLLILSIFALSSIEAQVVYRPQPEEWKHIIKGGQFMDRINPMPEGKRAKKTWGTKEVSKRYVDNGIEDDKISYWGGNIVKDEEGLYHLFVCGWDENNPKGHFGYPQSTVYHAICNNSVGPFKVKEVLGYGHNPEVVHLANGAYMVYHVTADPDKLDISKNMCYYYADNLNSKWDRRSMKVDMRDRPVRLGGGTWFHNMSFCQREDGSILAILRNGSIWISQTGTSTYNLITERSIYPLVDGRYEDPVIWYDGIQYNVIVNDWIGRVAFYLRSKDGINWISDPGTAYVPGVSVHEDGEKELWHKYERIRIYQDEQGRAIQANFAVIDSEKHGDMPNDNHSSKNIALPLNKGVLLTLLDKTPIVNSKAKKIRVKISGEKDFNPSKEVDVESLRFGANSEVNFGRGAKAIKSEVSGKDLIVTFEGINHAIDEREFAPKMLGKYKNGKMLFGYARLPWVNYITEALSARSPIINGDKLSVVVENFGQVASHPTYLTIETPNSEGIDCEVVTIPIPKIEPYKSLKLSAKSNSLKKGKAIVIKILTREGNPVLFKTVVK